MSEDAEGKVVLDEVYSTFTEVAADLDFTLVDS
jgi:hypothetical protein